MENYLDMIWKIWLKIIGILELSSRQRHASKTPENIVARVGMCDMFVEASLSICQNICTTPDFSMRFGNDPRRVRDSSGIFPVGTNRQTSLLSKQHSYICMMESSRMNPTYLCLEYKQIYSKLKKKLNITKLPIKYN